MSGDSGFNFGGGPEQLGGNRPYSMGTPEVPGVATQLGGDMPMALQSGPDNSSIDWKKLSAPMMLAGLAMLSKRGGSGGPAPQAQAFNAQMGQRAGAITSPYANAGFIRRSR